jgi:hypothetical protein
MTSSKLITELNKLLSRENLFLDKLRVDNTIIICGSGISIESGLPLGWDLVKKVLDTFDLGKESSINLINRFEEYNKNVISRIKDYQVNLYNAPRLEVLFKCLKDILTEKNYYSIIEGFLFYNYRRNEFNDNVFSNYQHFAIADFIVNGGTVLTSNFDNLIEHAIGELNNVVKYNLISFPLLQPTEANSDIGTLIKYHGDINQINSIGIDISNLHINGFNINETILLDRIFENKSNVIFIGFSVSDTLDLIPYLKNKRSLNYFYFNFIKSDDNNSLESSKSNIEKFSTPIDETTLEAYEYFYYKMPSTYVVNNYNNEVQKNANPYKCDKSIKPALHLTESDIIKMEEIISTLSNKQNPDHLAIKFNILKSYGLLNLISEIELNDLSEPWKSDFYNYYQNINGNYRYNFYKKKQNDDDQFKKFGVLQEYVFLQKRHWLDRIIRLMPLTLLFLRFKKTLKSINNQKDFSLELELKINRCVCLYYLRVFQLLHKLRLTCLVPKKIVLEYQKMIKRQIEIAKELNHLATYRFALKEYLYVKGFFRQTLNVNIKDLIHELIEIFELNIDTNYFIEANNLLRFGVTTIDQNRFKEPFFHSTELTKDYLNLNKV